MTLIVGTSGDTGPSALEACRGAENLSCIVLYPNGNVSSVQEWQMLRCHAECNNAHVVVVDGSSDDLDVPCEAALRDQELKAVHNLGTVNSVNIVRLIMQTCHFFHAYLSLPTTPPQLDVCIPSGAAGHLTACVLAKTMGLPLRHIVVATNQNDVLSIMVNEGVLARKERVVATNSNAMDIQVPYNFERLLFLLTEGDAEAVRTWVQMVHRGERVELPETVRNGFRDLGLKAVSIGQGAAEFEVLHTIRHVYGAVGYVLDPHTAVGVAAVRKVSAEKGAVVLSTRARSPGSHWHRCSCCVWLLFRPAPKLRGIGRAGGLRSPHGVHGMCSPCQIPRDRGWSPGPRRGGSACSAEEPVQGPPACHRGAACSCWRCILGGVYYFVGGGVEAQGNGNKDRGCWVGDARGKRRDVLQQGATVGVECGPRAARPAYH